MNRTWLWLALLGRFALGADPAALHGRGDAGPCVDAAASSPASWTTSILARPVFLGQHVFYPPSYIGVATGMFSGIRIWGTTGTTWRALEPTRGTFDFSRLDAHVDAIRRRNMEVLLCLGQTPRWASARPDEPGEMGLGAAAEPRDIADWIAYVRATAERYKGRISAYEIMNEPRVPEAIAPWSPGFFSGSVTQLVRLTKTAAETIRTVDPAAKIVSPGMTGDVQGVARLKKFLEAGGGQACDAIGFHFYLRTGTIAELVGLLRSIRALQAAHHLANLPIWNTETGVLIAESGRTVKPRESSGALSRVLPAADAAMFAAKVIATSHALGVERTYWFAHDSSSMGSTVPDKHLNALNDFGRALNRISAWLVGREVKPGASLPTDASGECRVYDRGRWAGTLFWGAYAGADALRQQGYKAIRQLDGTTFELSVDADVQRLARRGLELPPVFLDR